VRPGDPPSQLLSLAAGLALFDAVLVAAPGSPVMLKWPNDLLLDGAKLAGTLLERAGDRIVLGFGINLATAPAVPGRPVASLGGVLPPQSFAPLFAASFGRWLEVWRSGDAEELRRSWLERAHPFGTRLTVHTGPSQELSGRFEGLMPDGALRLLRDDGEVETVRAADVFLTRS
jgi:BirA family transcriptional regulator, biotin operon repressor / biotin---[acetyl-CoA-carboxylase] ligase